MMKKFYVIFIIIIPFFFVRNMKTQFLSLTLNSKTTLEEVSERTSEEVTEDGNQSSSGEVSTSRRDRERERIQKHDGESEAGKESERAREIEKMKEITAELLKIHREK